MRNSLFLALVALFFLSSCCCLMKGHDSSKPTIYDNSHLTSGELDYKAPAHWTKQVPSNPMRKDEYLISSKDQKAELSVYSFPGEVGGVEANIARWKSQFKDDGSQEFADLKQFNIGKLPVTIFSAKGTYLQAQDPADPSSPKTEVLNQGMLAGIVEMKDSLYFFKMIGDSNLIDSEKANFDQFMSSLKVN